MTSEVKSPQNDTSCYSLLAVLQPPLNLFAAQKRNHLTVISPEEMVQKHRLKKWQPPGLKNEMIADVQKNQNSLNVQLRLIPKASHSLQTAI